MKRLTVIDKAVVGSCLLLSLATMVLNAASPVARTLMQGKRVSALLIGSDYDGGRSRHSDTLMFVSFEPRTRCLDVMSIPRDTTVSIPERPSIRRVNEVFAYEFRHSGRDFNIASMALKGFVETMLSSATTDRLKIPFYVTIDYRSFRALVDAIGGIPVRVTEPMHYDDNWGHLHIHFEPGQYMMNGQQALEYVRYRGASADQGRVLRQQIFIKDVLKRLKSPILLWNLPSHARIVLDGIHTNFSVWDLGILLFEARRMKWKDLRLLSLPGNISGVYWKMNPEKTAQVLGLMQSAVPRETPMVSEVRNRAMLETQGIPTVEVWNASKHPRLTQVVVQLLRNKGFDVVKSGPFKVHQQRTLVIDRSGQLRPAQAVADVLRASHPEVISRVDLSHQVDVSVILGNDTGIKKGNKWIWQ